MTENKKARIGIIGYGFVGKAVEYGFQNRNTEIKKYDKFLPTDPFEETVDFADFIFICLPTPYKGDRIDLSIIDEMIGRIAERTNGTEKIIIIKSTVIPGTTKRLAEAYPDTKFVFNPEFLREKTSNEDFVNADRTVIGSFNKDAAERVRELYESRFPQIPQTFITDPTSAEMTKYMANLLLATRVIFANEMFELTEKLGIDYNAVKEMVVADKRMGNSHLDISPERGFGGKCFPKDLIALMGLYEDLGLSPDLLRTVWDKNLKIRKVKDWEDIPFVKTA